MAWLIVVLSAVIPGLAAKACWLTVSSATGGSVTTPGEGSFHYSGGQLVPVEATPEANCRFDGWTGTAVDAGKVADPSSASTTVTMSADYTLQANFAIDQRTLTVSSTGGGDASTPGEGSFQYGDGAVVPIEATTYPNHHFVSWTGTAVDAGKVADPCSASTTVTVSADYTLQANFGIDQRTLIVSSTGGGDVCTPGEGSFQYDHGTIAPIEAATYPNYHFIGWTGTAVDAGKVADPSLQSTTVTTDADYTLQANFTITTFTVIASADPNGAIDPNGSVTDIWLYGECEFTAIPNMGFEVDKWYLDGEPNQFGGTKYKLSKIQADHAVRVTFKQSLSVSLDDMGFGDEQEFDERVGNNNFFDPCDPSTARFHVQLVEGVGPDPCGAMLMSVLTDRDTESPTYGDPIYPRAKCEFKWSGADEVWVVFKYLFNTSEPGVELWVYVSDVPELLDLDDPARDEHDILIAQIPQPPDGWPGSFGSDRFAVFQQLVWVGGLDLTDTLWIELMLVKPEIGGFTLANTVRMMSTVRGPSTMAGQSTWLGGTSVLVDDWNPVVQCYGICLDINVDNFVNEADFLTVIGECGQTATDARACLDGLFSTDGTVDASDVVSWDWAMNAQDRLLNFCGLSLIAGGMSTTALAADGLESSSVQLPLADLPGSLSELLIAGKRSSNDPATKMQDRLYVFHDNGICFASFEPAHDRCNIRLVQGVAGDLYQLNAEAGVLRLDETGQVIIPPGEVELIGFTEPRYGAPATVYVGIQDPDPDPFGRPILDAAFDADYVYVVPVVVDPVGEGAYTAAAKLQLLPQADPPYQVVQLYDDPPPPGDNQYRDALREIELDGAGNLYMLNAHHLNESDILWRYKPDGTVERLDLGRPGTSSHVPAPIAMHMSDSGNMLYLASARYNPADPCSSILYGFSTDGSLTLERSVTITDMHHVTSITEDPATGYLWVAGFNMDYIPLFPNPFDVPFYQPYLAQVPSNSDDVQALPLADPDSHDLAMPISVVWTKNVKADIHDVAVTAITAPGTVIGGETAAIDVTVQNQGTLAETFDVTLTETPGGYSDTKQITLATGVSGTVSFSWDTAGVVPVGHTLTATAGPVAEETNTTDNSQSTAIMVEAMHVGDMIVEFDVWSGIRAWSIQWRIVKVTVPILSSSGATVGGATVYGSWSGSGAHARDVSGSTHGGGQVTFVMISDRGGDFIFTVNDVTKLGWTYDSAANFETSDSATVP
jgi:hypothetical protein